ACCSSFLCSFWRPRRMTPVQIITQRGAGNPQLKSRRKANSTENDSRGLLNRFLKVAMNCQAVHRKIRELFYGPTLMDTPPKNSVPKSGLFRYNFSQAVSRGRVAMAVSDLKTPASVGLS